MTKIVTVVGARPQFVKAAPVAKACIDAGVNEILLHTGQHYDYEMSQVFFEELGLPDPAYNLGIGGKSHGEMTGKMLQEIESILMGEQPDAVVVYGDTNSTLAAGLAAAKMHIPVAHVEAGLRSFNRNMPEEINRVVTDHLADKLFCPSDVSRNHLAAEGITDNVFVIGDVMADASLHARRIVAEDPARFQPECVDTLGDSGFALLTLHRAENTDSQDRLASIVDAVNRIRIPVVFPMHPRTAKALDAAGLSLRNHVKVISPVGYLAMTALIVAADCIVTDSGGLQKEAYWSRTPCITLRNETEWTETVDENWNLLVHEFDGLPDSVDQATSPGTEPLAYGDGQAAVRLVKHLSMYSGSDRLS